jgi:hypothetical protein
MTHARIILGALLFAFLTPAVVSGASPSGTRSIVACYNSGNQTVQSMYNCSGKWVTPRTFLFCVLDTGCPAYPDTVAGRADLLAHLGPGQFNTPLSIDPVNLPKLPTAKQISDCRTPGATEAGFRSCVLSAMGKVNSDALLSCAKGKSNQDIAVCLAKQTNNQQLLSVTTCMAGKARTPENVSLCLNNPALAAEVANARKCVTTPGKSAESCILPALPPAEAKAVNCLADVRGDSHKAAGCLASVNPGVATALGDVQCAERARTSAQAAACLQPHLGGDAAKVAGCVSGPKDKVVSCLVGARPEYQAAEHAYACIANGRDAGAFIENCGSGFVKDEKTREAMSCVARANGDEQLLAACAAHAVLPPEIARYASCAATSQGPTSFALCAAGPSINEEWRIAAECAVETGGNPAGFAGCTAGRLTVRELTKCLTGQIGKDCFGPNNTLRKWLDGEFNDLTRGPGKNNEIVKAINAIGEVTGGPNSVINKPEQLLGGPNSIFHNPGQIAGGPNSVINNPGQIAGGSNSVINNPGQIAGGSNSVINNPGQITGGSNSVINNPGQIFHPHW